MRKLGRQERYKQLAKRKKQLLRKMESVQNRKDSKWQPRREIRGRLNPSSIYVPFEQAKRK